MFLKRDIISFVLCIWVLFIALTPFEELNKRFLAPFFVGKHVKFDFCIPEFGEL